MNISSFTMLHTALSGVEAAQEELSTTGENISNETTPGYEEQTVNLSPSSAFGVSAGGVTYQIGTGVSVKNITNSSDSYLDTAWRSQNSATNSASTLGTYTDQLDSAVGDTSEDEGISQAMESFWTEWSDLSSDPTSASAKQAVVSAGTTLASQLNSLSSEISGSDASSVLSQAGSQYDDLLQSPTGSGATGGEVYNDAYEIASLNREISQATAGGTNANTLLDERNEYIDKLSSLGNVTTKSNSDGSVSVYFGGVTTQALVSDPSSDTSGSGDPGNDFTAWSTAFGNELSDSTSASSTASSIGGTLGALIGLAGIDQSKSGAGTIATADTLSDSTTLAGTIGTVMTSLDSVASNLANEVNSVYSSNGYSDDYFFSTSDGSSTTTAANIAVSSSLTKTPSSLSAGASGAASGDTTVSTAIAENSTGSSSTAGNAYSTFVELVGNIAASAEDNETTQSDLATQVTNQRDSAEGVDLNAELSNLISEQQAYEASAKVMNAFNTVMDSLMSVVSG